LLLTLSDLALWGPSHRDYVGGDDYELPWEDLHPGYRFVRALDVIVKRRRDLSPSDLSEPLKITQLLCAELGWMTPLQMVDNYLQADSSDRAGSRIARDALWDFRVRAAKARRAEPAVFIDATNEHEIHERFKLVLPFIVEQGRLRMPDSPELYELLLLSTVAHLAGGVFDGEPSRLFKEPQNISNMVHESALRHIFGAHAQEFSSALADPSSPTTYQLASELPVTASGLEELIRRLNQEGLNEFSRAVRFSKLQGRDAALDWFSRQPAVVEAVLDLREVRPDGSSTISWPALFGVLSQAIAASDAESLKELFEDCGYHYFNRDLEYLQGLGRWPTSH
jgi:hypothetical protein